MSEKRPRFSEDERLAFKIVLSIGGLVLLLVSLSILCTYVQKRFGLPVALYTMFASFFFPPFIWFVLRPLTREGYREVRRRLSTWRGDRGADPNRGPYRDGDAR